MCRSVRDPFTKKCSLCLTDHVFWDGFRGNMDLLALFFVHFIANKRLFCSFRLYSEFNPPISKADLQCTYISAKITSRQDF